MLTTSTTGMSAFSALRSTNRVCGSGPSEASTSSTMPSTMESPRSTSPPKSAWPGVSMMLIVMPSGSRRTDVVHRRVLREDRDALLALEVAGVHDPVGHALELVGRERAGLAQHRVDERGLAVVDVGDDRDVAQVVARVISRACEASTFTGVGERAEAKPAESTGRYGPPPHRPLPPGPLVTLRAALARGWRRECVRTRTSDLGGSRWGATPAVPTPCRGRRDRPAAGRSR